MWRVSNIVSAFLIASYVVTSRPSSQGLSRTGVHVRECSAITTVRQWGTSLASPMKLSAMTLLVIRDANNAKATPCLRSIKSQICSHSIGAPKLVVTKMQSNLASTYDMCVLQHYRIHIGIGISQRYFRTQTIINNGEHLLSTLFIYKHMPPSEFFKTAMDFIR